MSQLSPNGLELSDRGSLRQILFQACPFGLSLAQVVELPRLNLWLFQKRKLRPSLAFCAASPVRSSEWLVRLWV